MYKNLVTIVKRYVKNPSKILHIPFSKGLLNWLNDKNYLKLLYAINIKSKINLDCPTGFNEKLQWLKLYDRKPEYTKMVDKYEAKKYVADKIGEKYIIPTLGVWDHFDEIDFDTLPNQFVLKCTHDSGGLVICRDKSKLDKKAARKTIEKCLKRNYYWKGREWPYKNVKPRIIAEDFLSDGRMAKQEGLTDFKFFCFNGMPHFLYVSEGLENHDTARISFFDLNGNKLPFKRTDYKGLNFDKIPLPDCFQKMIEIAQHLAQGTGCPFIRIDLYEVKGKIYFSEITFSPNSGFVPFEPKSIDEYLGSLIDLTSINIKRV